MRGGESKVVIFFILLVPCLRNIYLITDQSCKKVQDLFGNRITTTFVNTKSFNLANSIN